MEISLTEIERELLMQVLESEIRDVRSEIYHAESHAAKEALKQREAVAAALLQRLARLTAVDSPV